MEEKNWTDVLVERANLQGKVSGLVWARNKFGHINDAVWCDLTAEIAQANLKIKALLDFEPCATCSQERQLQHTDHCLSCHGTGIAPGLAA